MYKNFLKFFLIFFFLYPNIVLSNDQKIAYLDIDFVIKNSNIGQNLLEKISNVDKKNIKILDERNKELKEKEINLKNKKNIISQEAFESEIKELQKKIKTYNEEKNKMVNDLNEFKNKEISNIFIKIGPILEKYMKEESIDVILNSKNIIIANPKLDITETIIDRVNKNL